MKTSWVGETDSPVTLHGRMPHGGMRMQGSGHDHSHKVGPDTNACRFTLLVQLALHPPVPPVPYPSSHPTVVPPPASTIVSPSFVADKVSQICVVVQRKVPNRICKDKRSVRKGPATLPVHKGPSTIGYEEDSSWTLH